jgi:hypothetical protein
MGEQCCCKESGEHCCCYCGESGRTLLRNGRLLREELGYKRSETNLREEC